ncbi:hypothetical protein [Caulobacter hibisci]|uniref:DprA winged helix domain-containing protein n=1 Tax=Caulobacter hibisci TaxID=2035993 RepID=A0ABS0T276_9CAUL|nr:hypothetical protein [Caulobacter hibisci]MBI1685985.1 hypothetical protein [Caulobacter hibisci]
MANATSQFLRTANAAIQSSTPAGPSEADVLSQLASGKAADITSLANLMGAPPNIIEAIVGKLMSDRFLDSTADGFKLSEIGARAARYLKLTEF